MLCCKWCCVYNANIKDIEDKIPDITNLTTNTTLNAKINQVKNKIPSITNLATATALAIVGNKTPDHTKNIITPEFNKITAEKVTTRLKQANLATKGDIVDFVKKTCFDNKLKNLNKKVTSNKLKHLPVENEFEKLQHKIDKLQTFDSSLFIGQM